MVKKKKGKEGNDAKERKSVQISSEITPFIDADEYFRRQYRHDFCLEAVQENNKAFAVIKEKYESIVNQEEELRKWEKFVNCDRIPDLLSAPAIRTYLYQWFFEEWMHINSTFNWLLDVNERSILTQDMSEPDLTRKHLETKIPPIELICFYHVGNGIKMMHQLERILKETEKHHIKSRSELVKVKNEIRNRIRSSIDNLTYMILINTEGNMVMIDPMSEKYAVDSESFKVALWALRNIQCDLEKLDLMELFIELEPIKSTVTIPLNAAYNNLVMRGLHLNFDHRSRYSGSYKLRHASLEVQDLKKVLAQEWSIRKELEQEKLDQMKREREQYEEDLRTLEEDAKQQESNKKDATKKGKMSQKTKPAAGKKKTKTLIEPPIVTDQTCLDMESEFNEREDREYRQEINMLRPETLGLADDEINLREYIILGGVYEYNFLYKPEQLQIPNGYFNSKEVPEKLKYRDFICQVEYEPKRRRTKSFIFRESRVLTASELFHSSTRGLEPANLDSKNQVAVESLIKITVKLPPSLCCWCHPKVCRWNTKPDMLDDKSDEDKMSLFSTVADTSTREPYETEDIDLGTMDGRKNLHYIIMNQILPRMDSLYKFPDEIEEERERLAGLAHEAERIRKEAALDSAEDEVYTGSEAESISGITPQSHVTQVKVAAESTPPANLFPCSNKVRALKINSAEFLAEEFPDEIRSLNSSEKKLLSQYLKEIDEQTETRRPIFVTWWQVMRLLSKDKSKMDSRGEASDTENTARSRIEIDRHARKSMKKSRARLKAAGRRSVPKVSLASISSSDSLRRIRRGPASPTSLRPKNLTDEEEVFSVVQGLWSSQYIFKQEFDEENSEMIFWTDRLGIFGFAFKRYLHFPFEDWQIYPGKGGKSVVLEIRSPFARFLINVAEKGYTSTVVVGGHTHAKIGEPINDLKKFITEMEMMGLNIFTKRDTCVYLEDIVDKHIPLEFHVYQTLSQFCLHYKFARSKWNWLAQRRVITLKCGKSTQHSYEMDTIQITPEQVQFCEVKEECTPLEQIKLLHIPTAKNKKFEVNLYGFLTSHAFGPLPEHQPKVQYSLFELLKAVRPLSFSK